MEQGASGWTIALVGSVAGVVGALAAVIQLFAHRGAKVRHPDAPSHRPPGAPAGRLSFWDRISLAATDPDDQAAGVVRLSLLPVLCELLAWVVLETADVAPRTATAWAVVALPILLATLVGFLSLIQLLFTVGEGFARSLVASLALGLCAVVILTSLDLVGALNLSRS